MIYDRRKLLPLQDADFATYKRERQLSRTKRQDDDDFFALMSWGLLGGSQGSPAKNRVAIPLKGAGTSGQIGHNSGGKKRPVSDVRTKSISENGKSFQVSTKPIRKQNKLPSWWSSVLGETPTRHTDFGMAWPSLKPI